MKDGLQEELPEDLLAAVEEEIISEDAEENLQSIDSNIKVHTAWSTKGRSTTTLSNLLLLDDRIERWIEIRDETGVLITVIELLSPSNKRENWQRYVKKQKVFTGAAVNLVEIDLIRRGRSVFPEPVEESLAEKDIPYAVCVFRSANSTKLEVYPIGLREPLPIIRIPLRPKDKDVTLELQPLIDQCHERGSNHLLDYERPLEPPLSKDDAEWLAGLLLQHGLFTAE